MSNAVVGESATDQTVFRPTLDHSGEVTNGDVDGVRRGFFESSWSFATAGDPQVEQEDLAVVASPVRGDGSPMSWVQMADCSLEDNADPAFCLADGLEVNVSEYDTDTGAIVARNVATGLSRSEAHKVRVRMFFYNGAGNDVVEVCVDTTTCRHGRELGGPPPGRSPRRDQSRSTRSPSERKDRRCPRRPAAGFFIDNFVAKAIASSGANTSVSGPLSVNEGDSGETAVPVQDHPQPAPADHRRGAVLDSRRHRHRAGGLHGEERERHLRTGRDGQDRPRCPCTVTPTTRSTSGSCSCSNRRSRPVAGPAPRREPCRPAYSLEDPTTVLDDDSTIRIDDVTLEQPPWGNEAAGFTVHLDNPSGRPVTVRFSTEDGSTTAPEDYTAVTDSEVTLPPGVVSTVVPVTIRSDTEEEDDERFVVHLHDATGGQIESAEAEGASGTPTTPTLRTSSWS